MAITLGDFITYLSLGLALVSLVVVIISVVKIQEQLVRAISLGGSLSSSSPPKVFTAEDDDDDDEGNSKLEISAIVSEFSSRLRRLEEALVDQKVKMEILELRLERTAPKQSAAPLQKNSSSSSSSYYYSHPYPGTTLARERETAPAQEAIEEPGTAIDQVLPRTDSPSSRSVYGSRSDLTSPPPPRASTSSISRPTTTISPGAKPSVTPPLPSLLVAGSSPPQNMNPAKKPGATEIVVLKLLSEANGRITAREIQHRIGKTREHTARMMNALYQEGLVERDVSVRPFVYSITQKGRDVLNT
jgi:predicted transcriptional regulator